MIADYLSKVRQGQIDLKEFLHKVLDECKNIDGKYHYLNFLCTEKAIGEAESVSLSIKEKKSGKLSGLLVSIKDIICVKGIESTAGSKILKGYTPLFDATVVERLRNEDAIIIGKTSCDEFGFGSFNTNVGIGFRIPKNPLDIERVTGGSSGGSAGLTKALSRKNITHVSICTSTGGSIECPASFCGVVGFCPTYGRVSRNGLISYANSLDKIGITAPHASDIKPVFEVIAGYDERDSSSLKEPLDTSDTILEHKKKLRIGVIREAMDAIIDAHIKDAMDKTLEELKVEGHFIEDVHLPKTFKYGVATYYIIATSEASTNLSCLSGLRYGQESSVKDKSFNEYFSEVRSQNFGLESKRRIMLGTFARMSGYRDAYYIKATKIRTLIIDEYKRLFKKYDILLSPTMPILAPKFSDVKNMSALENYNMDVLTVGPNLAGIPHATIPIHENEKYSIGMMAMSDHLQDIMLLDFLCRLEASDAKRDT